MSTPNPTTPKPADEKPRTLGDLLYGNRSSHRVVEQEWVDLVKAIAARDEPAFGELYERTHRLVFTLVMRIAGNRQTAEELTVDVFHDVWCRASRYDPADGTVLGWIMNQARSRALDRLRFERRKKRVLPANMPAAETPAEARGDRIEAAELTRALRAALGTLTLHERQAIEAAYFLDLSYTDVAARLNQPLGTIKSRIRSGLRKLRTTLGADWKEP